ncbi:zinc finger MYM-type protein 1 [Trichonephila clavipes]|nr:zinc finger MYM-type protein 1 [Trichonephila clavipes]
MLDFSDLKRGHIVRARQAGASVTKTSQFLEVSRVEKMSRPNFSQVAMKNNISKGWNTTENDISKRPQLILQLDFRIQFGLHEKKKSVLDKQSKEQLRKDTECYHNVLKCVAVVVKYLAKRGLAFRGTEEVFGSPHNGNFMGALELLAEFNPFIHEHIEQ